MDIEEQEDRYVRRRRRRRREWNGKKRIVNGN